MLVAVDIYGVYVQLTSLRKKRNLTVATNATQLIDLSVPAIRPAVSVLGETRSHSILTCFMLAENS